MEAIDKLVEQLDAKDQVKAYQAYQSLVQIVVQAGRPGNSTERAAVAAALAQHLTAVKEEKDRQGKPIRVPKYSAKVRGQIARWIGYVAGAAEVPALKQAMGDLDTREVARGALEQIPDSGATQALIDAATNGIGHEFRIGAINSLSRRNGAETIAGLKQCAADPNIEVRLAAVEALAKYPDPSLDSVMMAALNTREDEAPARVLRRLGKARIRLAETLITAGQKSAGKRIYQAILKGPAEEPQKKAARMNLQQLG